MGKEKRVLVLGSDGMLGHMVKKYLADSPSLEVVGSSIHFDSSLRGADFFRESELGNLISSRRPHYIVNCVGRIPQKGSKDFSINYTLPDALCRLSKDLGYRVIYPSTDCEFNGRLHPQYYYKVSDVPDAEDDYGKSKILGTRAVLDNGDGKVIRTSVIGFSKPKRYGSSLLDWLRSREGGTVTGYGNHFWNGVTTLSWAKICEFVILNYDSIDQRLIQVSGQRATKAEILRSAARVFNLDVDIKDGVGDTTVNRCLLTNFDYPSFDWASERLLMKQMIDYKEYMDEKF